MFRNYLFLFNFFFPFKNKKAKIKPHTKKQNAKFSDWDILPPHQFINPRIKSQS
jgi:hypothetical protein